MQVPCFGQVFPCSFCICLRPFHFRLDNSEAATTTTTITAASQGEHGEGWCCRWMRGKRVMGRGLFYLAGALIWICDCENCALKHNARLSYSHCHRTLLQAATGKSGLARWRDWEGVTNKGEVAKVGKGNWEERTGKRYTRQSEVETANRQLSNWSKGQGPSCRGGKFGGYYY